MNSSTPSQEQHRAVFCELAELVNTLALEERISIRTQLGEYTHDLKHLLGLVTGANALLQRYSASNDHDSQVSEMVEIIRDSALKIDTYIDLFARYLNQEIFIEEK